ncbi:methyltransferase domain-containing protein [Streptomyces sp. A3M-1-3]|uniref:class I SAM-dependent methyltransferase n=1 Tax=Streptomyces sp. A3M-1-3 TaxID=2962044 RepID=UPI0020B890FA|nr:methyltransferase domain-containing protein [Streptomyces sp. A3M-1-3]MCP3822101.1 methyltransferase domain-containing protein [Streptomyces sp. A3M-1-3]
MSTLSLREQELQAHFNAFHAARASSDLASRLYAEAMRDAYPAEVAASSSCDVTLLGTMVTRLCLRPGQILADVGCGTGGVGLWLARALAVRLVGVDISSTAVELAAARRSQFVPTEHAQFRVGTVEATGLPECHAHAVVCVDAMSNAAERTAALGEIQRILHPGARAVITRAVRRDSGTAPVEQAAVDAGFEVEHIDERPGEPAMWRRLYGLWIAHEADLRRDLGDVQAENMLREANRVLPHLDGRRALVMTLRRPGPYPAAQPDRVASQAIA